MIDDIGTAIIIPIIPKIDTPIVTATTTQIPGNPTVFPTTFGYIKFPSICCNIIINNINVNTFIGLVIIINNAPIPVPINAPNIGINAVMATITDIIVAYGIFNIIIPIKHNNPSIIASKNCPPIKLENIYLILALIKKILII